MGFAREAFMRAEKDWKKESEFNEKMAKGAMELEYAKAGMDMPTGRMWDTEQSRGQIFQDRQKKLRQENQGYDLDKLRTQAKGVLDATNARGANDIAQERLRGANAFATTKYVQDATMRDNDLNRNADSFFKLVDANRGFSTDGRIPRYGSQGGNGTDDIVSKLATGNNTPDAAGVPSVIGGIGNPNAATTPAFDIDTVLNQMDSLNERLNKPKGGMINGMPESDFMATWGNKPAKNDGGVNSSRYLSLAEQSPARQALLTPQSQAPTVATPTVTAPKPTGDIVRTTPTIPDFNPEVGFSAPDKSKYPDTPIQRFQKKYEKQDYRGFNSEIGQPIEYDNQQPQSKAPKPQNEDIEDDIRRRYDAQKRMQRKKQTLAQNTRP